MLYDGEFYIKCRILYDGEIINNAAKVKPLNYNENYETKDTIDEAAARSSHIDAFEHVKRVHSQHYIANMSVTVYYSTVIIMCLC